MADNYEQEMRIAFAETQRAAKVTNISLLRGGLTLLEQQKKMLELSAKMNVPVTSAMSAEIDRKIEETRTQINAANDEIAALDAELRKMRGV